MTATNHVLTGALIGVAISNPLVAVIMAFVSHFVLDAMPHYSDDRVKQTDGRFIYILFTDMTLAFLILVFIAVLQPANWLLLITCAVVGASPDLMWFWPWLQDMKGRNIREFGVIRRFHSRIQWCAKPWGIGVELFWALGVIIMLAKSANLGYISSIL